MPVSWDGYMLLHTKMLDIIATYIYFGLLIASSLWLLLATLAWTTLLRCVSSTTVPAACLLDLIVVAFVHSVFSGLSSLNWVPKVALLSAIPYFWFAILYPIGLLGPDPNLPSPSLTQFLLNILVYIHWLRNAYLSWDKRDTFTRIFDVYCGVSIMLIGFLYAEFLYREFLRRRRPRNAQIARELRLIARVA